MEFIKEELIKPPINYTGNKFKLLEQILPLFPNNINSFIDIFGGGGSVSCNVIANKIFYNELNTNVYNLIKYLYTCDYVKELEEIDNLILQYKLEKNNKESYYQLRTDYNNDKDIRKLFLLSSYCMNYMIRFNKNNEFNQACGNGEFSKPMRDNFIKFAKCKKNIEFLNYSFEDINIDKLTKDDFIYLDPPYFLTVASYNENGGWNERLENKMYELCNNLNNNNIKFAMSNVILYKNKEHTMLKNWSKKYNVNELNYQYTKNNLHGKDLNKKDIEVLITNY
jgi:DNA adenine methylase Dam